MTLMCSWECL